MARSEPPRRKEAMNLENLDQKAVRSTRATARVTSLSERELKAVVGSGIVGDDNPRPIEAEPDHPPVPPEICAIHFYYPADGAV
jgi:hypothetical protein